jgi:hypothetical protein
MAEVQNEDIPVGINVPHEDERGKKTVKDARDGLNFER